MSQPQELAPREPDLGKFRLGEWSVHRAEGTLRWNGRSARLEPRVMDVLVYLASEPGRVISKQELLGAVWGGAFVEEGALSQAIHSLRKALGDSARHPRYVQTIPKRGYRLLAPVVSDQAQRVIDDSPVPPSEPASWAPPAVSLRSRRSCLLLSTSIALAGLVVLWLGSSGLGLGGLRNAWPLVQRLLGKGPSIAVLPFENLGKPEDGYFADGLTEKIAEELASTSWRRVRTRPDILRGRPPFELAKELKADYVLLGTVHWADHGKGREPEGAGGPQLHLPGRYTPVPDKNTARIQGSTRVPRVQITYQLIRVGDNTSISTDTFEEDVTDAVQAQEQLSHRVVEALGTTLAPRKSSARNLLETTVPLEALGLKFRREGRLVEAVEVFRRASDLEPRSARLTPKIAAIYRALREHEQAEHYLVKGFSLGPKVFYWKQSALNLRAWKGDPKQVRALLKRSPVPENPELQAIAFQLDLDERDYARALARLSPEWVQRLPFQDRSRIYVMAVLARERLGDGEGALKAAEANRALLESYARHFPKEPMIRAYLAMALAQLGQRNEALAQAERAVHDSRHDAFSGPRTMEVQAMVDTMLGRHREAITRLARLLSMDYQESICIPELRIDPVWDPLRGDPAFEALLQGRDHNSS